MSNVVLFSRDVTDLILNIADTLRRFTTSANLNITSTGIQAILLDSAQACLCVMYLPNDLFNQYHVEKPRTIGIDLNSFWDFLKCAKTYQHTLMQFDDKLNILCADHENDISRKQWTFKASMIPLHVDDNDLTEPENTNIISWKITSKRMKMFMKELNKCKDNDTVCLKFSKDNVQLSSDSDSNNIQFCWYPKVPKKDVPVDLPEVSNDSPKESPENESDVSERPAKRQRTSHKESKANNDLNETLIYNSDEKCTEASYCLKYLLDVTNSSISDFTTVEIMNTHVLLVNYKFGNGWFKFYLAPKLPSE